MIPFLAKQRLGQFSTKVYPPENVFAPWKEAAVHVSARVQTSKQLNPLQQWQIQADLSPRHTVLPPVCGRLDLPCFPKSAVMPGLILGSDLVSLQHQESIAVRRQVTEDQDGVGMVPLWEVGWSPRSTSRLMICDWAAKGEQDVLRAQNRVRRMCYRMSSDTVCIWEKTVLDLTWSWIKTQTGWCVWENIQGKQTETRMNQRVRGGLEALLGNGVLQGQPYLGNHIIGAI